MYLVPALFWLSGSIGLQSQATPFSLRPSSENHETHPVVPSCILVRSPFIAIPQPTLAVAVPSTAPAVPGALPAAAAAATAAGAAAAAAAGPTPAAATPLAAGVATAPGAAAGAVGAGGSGAGGGAKLEASLLANLKKKIQEKAAAPEKLKTTGVAFQAVEEVSPVVAGMPLA